MAKVFIDGSSGTTGLQIAARLAERADIEFITLPEESKKDPVAKKQAINAADIVFLCLPDAAAIESAALLDEDNKHTVIIDASTAHRTNDNWTYGMPELAGQYEKIQNAQLIANPGCHASGVIALVTPLIKAGVVPADAMLSVTSLTGYSGGGKAMIAQYEADAGSTECCGCGDVSSKEVSLLAGGRLYGLTQAHKHLPEIQKMAGLTQAPVFCPVVEPYYSGMQTIIPLTPEAWGTTVSAMQECLKDAYGVSVPHDANGTNGANAGDVITKVGDVGTGLETQGANDAGNAGMISYVDPEVFEGFVSATTLSGYDNMWVTVTGDDRRAVAIAVFDNLGKGASGAAIQNMNIALGINPQTSLKIK